MIIAGVDPGPEQSAIVVWTGDRVILHATLSNDEVLAYCRSRETDGDMLVFEQVHMGGMPAGIETFETVFWTGRFYEAAAHRQRSRLRRQAVKMHICGSVRANDSNIRQALIDRYGPSKAIALGSKSSPGVFYGIKGHEWAALSIAVTWFDQQIEHARKAG